MTHRRRGRVMGTRAVLTAGIWSYLASLAAPVRLRRGLPAGCAGLADAPAVGGWELFPAAAVICAPRLVASGWRQHRQRMRGGGG